MRKTARNSLLFLCFLGLAAAVAGGFLVYKLIAIPFGTLFDMSLAAAFGGVVLVFAIVSLLLLLANRVWKTLAGAVLMSIPVLLIIVAAIAVIDHRALYLKLPPPKPSAEEWREDIDYLTERMVVIHPNLFAKTSGREMIRTIARIDRNIPEVSDSEVLAGIFEITALPRDGHTFPFVFMPCYKFGIFPLQTFVFEDGLYVVNGGRDNRRLVGSRIVAIEGTPVDDVIRRLRRFIPADGPYNELDRIPQLLMIAELLEAEGIIKDRRRATFTFEDRGGREKDVTLRPINNLLALYWGGMRTVSNLTSPVISNDREDAYWFELRDGSGGSRVLYVGFNKVVDEWNDDTFEDFVGRLDAFMAENDVDRTIIDIRCNDGGNGALVPGFVEMIKGHEKINQPGKLFVLIGRRTFSAAVMFASMMANNTRAVFIGEPTGQGPNFYSQPRIITLPNSKYEVAISTDATYSSLAWDNRQTVEPDVYVDCTIDDFLTGRDPVLAAAVSHTAPERAPAAPPSETEGLDRMQRAVGAACAGRYLLSPYQILSVEQDNGGLEFWIDDFVEESCVKVSSALYPAGDSRFDTDIKDVTLEFVKNDAGHVDRLHLMWKHTEKVVRRVPDDHRLPMEFIAEGEIDRAVEAFLASKDVYIERFKSLEMRINRMGYSFLREERVDDAVKIFTLNVELFPLSSNVYDSLGEAYMERGDNVLAIENYEKSLELNPDNKNAVEMLKRIRGE